MTPPGDGALQPRLFEPAAIALHPVGPGDCCRPCRVEDEVVDGCGGQLERAQDLLRWLVTDRGPATHSLRARAPSWPTTWLPRFAAPVLEVRFASTGERAEVRTTDARFPDCCGGHS